MLRLSVEYVLFRRVLLRWGHIEGHIERDGVRCRGEVRVLGACRLVVVCWLMRGKYVGELR